MIQIAINPQAMPSVEWTAAAWIGCAVSAYLISTMVDRKTSKRQLKATAFAMGLVGAAYITIWIPDCSELSWVDWWFALCFAN